MSPEVEDAGKAQLMASGLVMASLPPQSVPLSAAELKALNPRGRGLAWRISEWWYGLKVKMGLATDWLNADNAPPAFASSPHKYVQMPDLKCCPKCGGGRLHKIHTEGVR